MPIDLNSGKLRYYPFIISMNRCDGSSLTVADAYRTHLFINETIEPEIIQ